MLTQSNKSIVLELLDAGFARGDRSVFERLVALDYVQHNAFVRSGRAGLLTLLADLQQMPDNQFRVARILEEGPLVTLHAEWSTGSTRRAVFDLFRLENGMLVEHWDVIQEHPATTTSGRAMVDGSTAVSDVERSAENKALVEEFVHDILLQRRFGRLGRFFEGDRYIQHNPLVGDGVAAFHGYMGADDGEAGVRYSKLHRILGEGNFVLTQSEGARAGVPCAFFDLFRVAEGKLAEHWDVIQAIPPVLPHSNGFF